MKQRESNPSATRRAFLKGAAAVATGAAAGAVATGAAARTPAAAAATDAQPRNYRETAHIRAYYQAARF